jgi:hypothetical protein
VRRAELVPSYSSEFSSDQQILDLFTAIDYGRYRFVCSELVWLGRRPEQGSCDFSTCSTASATTGARTCSA